MSDYVVAVTLLTAPLGTPEVVPPDDRWPAVSEAVQTVAMSWKILDAGERKYIFADVKDFQIDIDILRGRVLDYAIMPRFDERRRFPDRRTCAAAPEFNRAYLAHLESIVMTNRDQADEIQDAIVETDRLYRVWEALRDA
jgi:hypothetical protein